MNNPSDRCIREIYALQALGMHRGLDRMEEALRRLGNPERRFRSVHVAGTNGKGSTCAMLAHILKLAGLKAGLTISPHVLDYRERIQAGGEWIPKRALVSLHEKAKKELSGLPLTFFEWTILLAFLHFAESGVDLAILETGMGGRWDATNTAKPLIGAITNVSLDHQEHLGETLGEILEEKMRILKPGMEAWSGVEGEALNRRLDEYCAQTGVTLRRVADYFTAGPGAGFSVAGLSGLRCALEGEHQKKNAALAVCIALSLRERGFAISDAHIRAGIGEVFWPGRLEVVSQRPRVVLDGAHNLAGVGSLAAYLEKERSQGASKLHLVFATLNNRPFESMLEKLIPFAKSVRLAEFEGKQTFTPEELKSKLRPDGNSRREILPITPRHWRQFLASVPPEDTVLVTGSLYLISQVRALAEGAERPIGSRCSG